MLHKKLDGFTLTELMVVLVIVGILVLIALPNFQGVISDAYAVEAKTQLRHVHTLQQNYRMVELEYANDLDLVKYIQPKLKEDGGEAIYKVELIEASESGFTARARATRDFDGDGQYNEWTIDQDMNLQEVTPD